MPLKNGKGKKVISHNIAELHKGPQYKRAMKKFGKAEADKQAVAVAYAVARNHGKHKKRC